ncbi:MAG TPA: class I SAM-dependent methyltransferase [Candidatus Binatia bacterium]|nr:class I SAM-dependent methyltransferase [Candidatus Binatia bacterium]
MKIEADTDWDVDALSHVWPRGLDASFYHGRILELTAAITAKGRGGSVLEVGSGNAGCSERLVRAGLTCFALEPSRSMIERAQSRMAEAGLRVTMVRGIAEQAPFRDHVFDRVLSDASIDHLADPRLGVREMARLLKPDGRLIIGAVNYGGLTVRASRAIYRVGRTLGRIPPDQRQFWDTPVPYEHTFECTLPVLRQLCGEWLALDYARGVSIGFAFPGWGTLLSKLPARVAAGLLVCLDRLAYRLPRIADYIVSVWKPKGADRPG